MKLAKIFYLAQIAGAVLFLVFGLFQTVRSIIIHSHGFIVVCFAVMTFVAYSLMYVPSVKEYKDYKARSGK